jgi:hypothetical protein
VAKSESDFAKILQLWFNDSNLEWMQSVRAAMTLAGGAPTCAPAICIRSHSGTGHRCTRIARVM